MKADPARQEVGNLLSGSRTQSKGFARLVQMSRSRVFLAGQRRGAHPTFEKLGGSQSIQLVSPHGVMTMLSQRQSAITSAETAGMLSTYVAIKELCLAVVEYCQIRIFCTSHWALRLCK